MSAIPKIILEHLPSSLKATDLKSRSGSVLYHEPSQSTLFTKVAQGKDVPQLIGEAEGLRAMGLAAPDLVPKLYSFGYDDPSSRKEAYMISQWFEMAGSWQDPELQKELGRKLAGMHRYRTDVCHEERFGFMVPTHCGPTEQDNTWEDRWDAFYRDRRLGDLVRRIGDPAISESWEKMKERCVHGSDPPLVAGYRSCWKSHSSLAVQHRSATETRDPARRSMVG